MSSSGWPSQRRRRRAPRAVFVRSITEERGAAQTGGRDAGLRLPAGLGTEAGEELQVAAGLAVERHVSAGGVGGEASDVTQDGSLVLLEVGQRRRRRRPWPAAALPGRRSPGRRPGSAIAPTWAAASRLEAVGRQVADRRLDALGRRLALGQEELGRAQAVEFGGQEVERYLGGSELARGHVDVGDAGQVAVDDERRQVVVGPLVEEVGLDDRARGDDAHHLAVHQGAALRRLADLLADSDLVAFADKLSQVAIERVMREARQRHAHALAHRPRGEDDLQLARHELGVLVERLVEVAQPEEDDGLREAALDLQVLAAQGRGHGLPSRVSGWGHYTARRLRKSCEKSCERP